MTGKYRIAAAAGVIALAGVGVGTAEASGKRRPPAPLEGEYVLSEPCTGWPEDTVCCGPGDAIRKLPLPTSEITYVKNGDGRRRGVRWFATDTFFEISRDGLDGLRIVPIGAEGPMEPVVLRSGHVKARTVRFDGHGVSVRDRFAVPGSGMSRPFDLDRQYRIEAEENGDLRLTYDGANFFRVPDSVCRLRRVR